MTAVLVAADIPPVPPDDDGLPPGQPYVSPDDLASIPPLFAEAAQVALLPLVAEIWQNSAGTVHAQLVDAANLPGLPPVSSLAAETYLAQAANTFAQVGDDLWNTARSELLAGFEAGESIPQLADRLRSSAGMTARKATLVARTQVLDASNAGSYATAQTSGIDLRKGWLDTPDNRTRITHRAAGAQYSADQQMIPLADQFMVGGYSCDRPHDPTLPPAERFSCRCALIYSMGTGAAEEARKAAEPVAPLPNTSGQVEPPPLPVAVEAPTIPIARVADEIREIEVENQIRAAYREIPRIPAGWTGLADLRDKIGDSIPRAEVDAALKRLARQPGVRLEPSDMGSTFPWTGKALPLGERDRLAALDFGGTPHHMIQFRDASPRPLPVAAKPPIPTARLTADEIHNIEVENAIRAAYRAHGRDGDYVGLAEIRAELGANYSRAEVDATLRRLAIDPGSRANIVPQSNQKALTQADRAAALHIGGQERHFLHFEDASPRPLPRVGGPEMPGLSKEAYGRRQAAVLDVLDTPGTTQTRFRGGNMGGAHLVTTPDGRKAVRKELPGDSAAAKYAVDSEILAGRVHEALDLRSVAAIRHVDDLGIEYVPGKSGEALVIRGEVSPTTGKIIRPDVVPDDILESRDGRRLGLADLLTNFSDRAGGNNWIRAVDGRLVGIDNTMAFRATSDPWYGGSSAFARRYVQRTPDYRWELRDRIDFSPDELAAIRRRLVELGDEFTDAGRASWHSAMMGRLDKIEARTVGPAAELSVSPLAARSVVQLRALAKQRGITGYSKLTKPKLLERLGPPQAAPVLEGRALREAARERNRIIEQRAAAEQTLAELDDLLVKKASREAFEQRIAAAQLDPKDLAALRAAVGDPAKMRAAVTRISKKQGITVQAKTGAKVKFDPALHDPVGEVPPAGTPVTVIRRGTTLTVDGDTITLNKAVVKLPTAPVKRAPAKAVKAAPKKAAPEPPAPSDPKVAALPRTVGKPPAPAKAAKATNPKFGSTDQGHPTYRDAGKAGRPYTPDMGPLPSGAYEQNCSNVVNAFEMRMRGFDVQAAPLDVLDKYGYAAGRTVAEMDQQLAAGWRLADGTPHGRSFSGQQWRSFTEIDGEIDRTWPDGGRGFIFVGKHIFNVVKVRGKPVYYEAQFDASATRNVTALYRRKYGGESGQAKLFRVDDLEPVAGILDTITPI